MARRPQLRGPSKGWRAESASVGPRAARSMLIVTLALVEQVAFVFHDLSLLLDKDEPALADVVCRVWLLG